MTKSGYYNKIKENKESNDH